MEHLLVFALLVLGFNAAQDEEDTHIQIDMERNEINTPKLLSNLWRSGYTNTRESQGCNNGGGKGGGGGGGKGGGKIGGKKKGKLTSLSDPEQLIEKVAVTNAKEDKEACMDLMKKPECCETMRAMKEDGDEKCKDHEGRWKCEDSVCFLEKRGLMDGDQIDEVKVKEMMKGWEEKDPDIKNMTARIEQKCLVKQYNNYAREEDVCDAMKFHLCVAINAMVECENIKSDDECKEMPEDKKKCKKFLDKGTE